MGRRIIKEDINGKKIKVCDKVTGVCTDPGMQAIAVDVDYCCGKDYCLSAGLSRFFRGGGSAARAGLVVLASTLVLWRAHR